MEKITIEKIVWKPTSNAGLRAGIHDGSRWLGYFAKKGYDWEGLQGHLQQGITIDAEVSKNGEFWNITSFVGEGVYRQGASPQPTSTPEPPQIEPTPAPTPTPAPEASSIQPSPEMHEELSTSSGDFFADVNTIVNQIITNSATLDANILSNFELKLSAIGVQLAQRLSENNSNAKTEEHAYKNNLTQGIKAVLSSNEGMTKTSAKENAESELQEQKSRLIVLQNKVFSYQTISDGLTQLIFALKDRIKYRI